MCVQGKQWLVFSRCWCCLTLRTGSLIVAFTETVLFLVATGLLTYLLFDSSVAVHIKSKFLCDVVFNLLVSVLLIYGTIKGKQVLVNGYLWLRVSLLLTDLFYAFVQGAAIGNGTVIAFTGLFLLFILHNMIIVRSYSLQMGSEEPSRARDNPTSYAQLQENSQA